jgi:hypothetical protein
MPYDRTKAIDYARKFWDRPCDDGVFWLSNTSVDVAKKRLELNAPEKAGWEARFQPDAAHAEEAVFLRTDPDGDVDRKLIWPWAGLADCAHFLSKCLQAGGLRDIREVSVPHLIRILQARAYTKTLAERVTRVAGQRIVNSGILKPGDMLGYFNIDPRGDYGGAPQYSHSTMYVGKLDGADDGRITCHTKSRFAGLSPHEDRWWLSASYTYTFIHIGMDDPAPTAALAGWWRIPYRGTTFYYLVTADGHAGWTLDAPSSSHARLDVPDGKAYWFQSGARITFIWRSSGTVEVWSPGAKPNEYDVKENDDTAGGTATKIF